MGCLHCHPRLWLGRSAWRPHLLPLCLWDFKHKGTIDQRTPRPEAVITAQGLVLG